MNTNSTLDLLQFVVGIYCIYTAIKGEGNMYNFFDVPDEFAVLIHKRLRIIYAVCGIIALTESALCMWSRTSASSCPIPADTVSVISSVMSFSIVIILVATFIWIRILAKKSNN